MGPAARRADLGDCESCQVGGSQRAACCRYVVSAQKTQREVYIVTGFTALAVRGAFLPAGAFGSLVV